MPATDPVIPVFPAGYQPVTTDFNTWVQAPFTFLTTKVMFRAELQGTVSVGASSLMTFGATAGDILEDPYSGWSDTATGSQPAHSWLCPAGCSGWYEVTLTGFELSPGASAGLEAELWLNGVLWRETSFTWGVNGQPSGTCGSVPVVMTAGFDYVQFYMSSTATVNTPATAGQYPTMEIAWISE